MGREIGQFYIPDRNLQESSSRPNVNVWTDIGEAKINQTIFGKAKVSVIRKQDKKRRAWLWAMLALTAIAAASWQGWVTYQLRLRAAPPPSLSESIKVSPPVFQSVNSPLVAAPPAPQVKPRMPPLLAPNSLPASPTKNTNPAKNQIPIQQPLKSTVVTPAATPATPTFSDVKAESKQPEIVVPLADPLTRRDSPNLQP